MDKRFVWREVENIVSGYPLMECDRYAIDVTNWLRQNNIPYKIIQLKTKRRSDSFIVSRRFGMSHSITENGVHYGVEVFGLGVRPSYDTFSNQGNSCLAKLSWNPFKNHIVN